MTRLGSGGRIEVICGCMYSGKTEELIRRLHHVQIARQRLQAFTPRRDTRYAIGNLVSHNGVRIEAQAIDSIRQLPDFLHDEVQVVALDELHFLDDDPDAVLTTCQSLADRGLRVLVAGLDQDFRAAPFPAMSRLLSGLIDGGDRLPDVTPRQFADLLQRLMEGETIRAGGATHPRLRPSVH